MRHRRAAILGAGLLLLGVGAMGLRAWNDRSPEYGTRSDTARLAYLEGENAVRRFEWPVAREALERAVTADSTFALAHLLLAHSCRALGDFETSQSHLHAARTWGDSTATEEESWRIRYELAVVDRDVGAREHAFDQMVQRFPESSNTLLLQARRAREAQDNETALHYFQRALEKDPSRVDLHNDLGYVALELGDYEAAVTSLQRYAYYVPDAANPHDSLGEAYLLTGRYHESWPEYLRALEIDESFLTSAIGASDALTMTGQNDQALHLIHTTQDLFKQRGQATLIGVKRAQILYAKRLWPEVIEETTARLATEEFSRPGSRGHEVWLRALRTLALAEEGRIETARVHLDTCLARLDDIRSEYTSPSTAPREDIDLLRASLQAFLAVREGDAAATRLAELRELIDGSRRKPHRLVPYRTMLSECLLQFDLYEEAIEVAGVNLEFNPRHPRSNLVVCKSLLRLRRREEALPYLQTYLDMMRLADEDHAEVEEARRILQRVLPSS